MSPMPITTMAASILGLTLIILSFKVIQMRFRHKTSLGDGGHDPLLKAVRAHGNFTEHVPLALILLGLAEMNGVNQYAVLTAGVLLVFGRLLHGFGLTRDNEVNKMRQFGTLITWTSIIICSISGLMITLT